MDEFMSTSLETTKITLKTNEILKSLFRPLTDEEYKALKHSIDKNGQLNPIIIMNDGTIIDGHHRLKACGELNKEPWIVTLLELGYYAHQEVDTVLKFAYEANGLGRESTNYSKVIAAAKTYLSNPQTLRNLEYGEKKLAYLTLVSSTGLSKRTIESVQFIESCIGKNNAPKDMEQQLITGSTSIDAAQKILREAAKIEDAINSLGYNPQLQKKMRERYKDNQLKFEKNAYKTYLKYFEEIGNYGKKEENPKGYKPDLEKVISKIDDLFEKYNDNIDTLNLLSNADFDAAIEHLIKKKAEAKSYAFALFLLPDTPFDSSIEVKEDLEELHRKEKEETRNQYIETLKYRELKPEEIEQALREFDEFDEGAV
jgi:ParB-like chromosome segregation protein Spo0J